MGTMTIAVLGICCGLLVALFGNLVVLPYVLRQQSERLAADRRIPVIGWDKQRLATATTLAYRFVIPLVFAIVGAVTAVEVFGEAP